MAKLTSAKRNKLKSSDFAEPGKRKYPVEDKSHAKNALARVSQHGTSEEKAEVRAKVHRKFPSIKVGKKASKKKAGGNYKRHWSQKKTARKKG